MSESTYCVSRLPNGVEIIPDPNGTLSLKEAYAQACEIAGWPAPRPIESSTLSMIIEQREMFGDR